jgi:hypothetical protein
MQAYKRLGGRGETSVERPSAYTRIERKAFRGAIRAM